MSKIICEICGTKYPDTVEQCPICGYTNGVTAKTEVEDEIVEEIAQKARPKTKGGRFSKSNVRKHIEEVEETEVDEFNVDKLGFRAPSEEEKNITEDDEEEEEDLDEEDDEDDEDEEEEGKSGVLLNVLLGIVIVALLCVSGFIFVRYFLPNVVDKEPAAPTETYAETQAPETQAPETVVTEAPTVPCTDLLLGETVIELDEVGQMHLINAAVEPADTTDELVFASSDESVVIVNEEGRVTAVGSGMAVIHISCGEQSVDCVVSVDVPEETVPEDATIATEEPTEPETEPGVEKTVTNAFVNIRSGAGTNYEKVGEYKQGDVVTIYEEKMVGGRPWGRTDDGWICTEYVK